MTTQEHIDAARLILDNTRELYDRQMAIYRLYYRDGDVENYYQRVCKLADDVINTTNLVESSHPMIEGETREVVRSALTAYVFEGYIEWRDDKQGTEPDTEDKLEAIIEWANDTLQELRHERISYGEIAQVDAMHEKLEEVR